MRSALCRFRVRCGGAGRLSGLAASPCIAGVLLQCGVKRVGAKSRRAVTSFSERLKYLTGAFDEQFRRGADRAALQGNDAGRVGKDKKIAWKSNQSHSLSNKPQP